MALSTGYVVKETATNLRRNLLMTVASVLTIFISLGLVGAAMLVSQGVDKATIQWKGGVELSVFMDPEATENQLEAVQRQLSQMKPQLVKRFTFVSKEDAFEEFNTMFRDQEAFRDSLTVDDMPPSYRVVPTDAEQIDAIGEQFKGASGVYRVEYAKDAIDQLLKSTRRNQIVFLSIAIVLLVSAALLIFNTIQMAIYSRRREVAVMKLVGATNWFIRIPFMLEGTIQGVAGAAVAFLAVYLARDSIVTVAAGSSGALTGFTTMTATPSEAIGTGLFLLVVGAIVGAVGSAVAVRRFLDV